ncbi:MAG: hypothetical protein NZO58_01935, partial [Gemmataceae bacterium]|nr:hypothetical protein [Gemmataceae bacterium]
GVIGGKVTRNAMAMIEAENKGLDVIAGGGKILKPGREDGPALKKDPKHDNVIAVAKKIPGKEMDPTKIWEEAFAQGGISPALVIATAD